VNVWHEILKDYDEQIVFQVLKDVIKNCKYPPSVSDITDFYNEQLKAKEWREKMAIHEKSLIKVR